MSSPRLHSIWIAPESRIDLQSVPTAIAIADVGLDGDRYARGVGTFRNRPETHGRQLSLIAHESLAALADAAGVELSPGATRRNLVTEGIDLAPLAKARLRIGEVEIECTSTCPPCGHLDRLLGIDTRTPLRNRGGLRARILVGGMLEAGAPIAIVHVPPPLP